VGKKRRPRSEPVFWPALKFRILYFPSNVWHWITWRLYRTHLRIWRVKNVDIPYQKRRRDERIRQKRRQRRRR
jgi:hypothetical protein